MHSFYDLIKKETFAIVRSLGLCCIEFDKTMDDGATSLEPHKTNNQNRHM